jgi:uncharacterized membrane protein
MFGLSFILPFILGLFSILNVNPGLSTALFHHVNLIFLIVVFLLILLWNKKKYFTSLSLY